MKKIAAALLLPLLAGVAAYAFWIRHWLLEWGSTDAERGKSLPGDDVVSHPRYEATHSVTIQAPAEEVWKWLVQIGQGRGGFYTYDALENLIGLNMHSADRIDPDLQSLTEGDIVSLAPDNEMPMWVVTLDPPSALVLSTGRPESPVEPGDYLKGEIAGSWAFILEPVGAESTRFIVRFRSDWQESALASALNLVMLEPAHCIMERGMMLGIKKRAERTVSQHAASPTTAAA